MVQRRYCAAPGCSNVKVPKSTCNYMGKFHSFPDRKRFPEQFLKWVLFCEREPHWVPPRSAVVCDTHFVANEKSFRDKQVPTIPANMIFNRCDDSADLPSNLPLDSTLELFQDEIFNGTLSLSPKKSGLPADRTLDTTLQDQEDVIISIEQPYHVLELCLANIALVRIPVGWTLLLADFEVVLFAEVDKTTTELTRSVGLKPDLSNIFNYNYRGTQFDDFFTLNSLQDVGELLHCVAASELCVKVSESSSRCEQRTEKRQHGGGKKEFGSSKRNL